MVIYKVSCGHPACTFSARVELERDPGQWRPATTSDVLDGNGTPIVVPWPGQPLTDAYAQHYEQVHAPMHQPPMCEWSVVA